MVFFLLRINFCDFLKVFSTTVCVPKTNISLYTALYERKTQVVIEQTRFLNTVFLYSEFNASPTLQATAGHLPALSVPGVGHLQILRCPGARHLPTPNFWHARGFRYQNITSQWILLEKHADWLTSQGQEKIEEVCNSLCTAAPHLKKIGKDFRFFWGEVRLYTG